MPPCEPWISQAVVPGLSFSAITQRASTPSGPGKVAGPPAAGRGRAAAGAAVPGEPRGAPPAAACSARKAATAAAAAAAAAVTTILFGKRAASDPLPHSVNGGGRLGVPGPFSRPRVLGSRRGLPGGPLHPVAVGGPPGRIVRRQVVVARLQPGGPVDQLPRDVGVAG